MVRTPKHLIHHVLHTPYSYSKLREMMPFSIYYMKYLLLYTLICQRFIDVCAIKN